MGDWVVLKSWNQAPGDGSMAGFHDGCLASDPRKAQSVYLFSCFPVVEQHQFDGPEVPEFTISVKWQEGDLQLYMRGQNSYAHGWRYVMRWTDYHGRNKVVTGYGFPTEQAARDEAEKKATKIVKAQQPEKVYKFRPEV